MSIPLKFQADSNITLRQRTPQISHIESSYTSHIGHLITAVLDNLTDQIKLSASALVTQILIEPAERGDSNVAQFQLTATVKTDYQKGNY